MEGLIHGGAYLRNFTVFFFVFKYRINFAGNCSIVSQRKELQYLRCYCAKMVTFLLSYISYFKSVCNAVNVVVQSYPWSKFLFSLHQTFNIPIPYPKTKKSSKIWTQHRLNKTNILYMFVEIA